MNTRDVVIGATMGSALMFMLDPDRGARRRALVRDTASSAARKTRHGLDATGKAMATRATGVAAAARRRWSNESAEDDRLVARIRAVLGQVASYPGTIEVEAYHGCVTVRGPVLASEVSAIIAEVASVPGVADLVDELDPHGEAGGPSSFPGTGRGGDAPRRSWAPARGAMAGAVLLAAGACMALAGLRQARSRKFEVGSK